jgi:hypothetical protein
MRQRSAMAEPSDGRSPTSVQRRKDGVTTLLPVQRQPPSTDESAPVDLAAIAQSQVAVLPDLGPGALPDPAHVQEGRQEADAVQGDLPELGADAQAGLGDWERDELSGGQAPPDARPIVAELAQARGEADLPAPAKPGRLSRAGKAVSSFFSGVGDKLSAAGRAIKGAFSRENRRDVGAKAPTVGAIGGPIAGHVQAGSVGSQFTGLAHGAPPPQTLEHTGDFARSFTSGTFELVHQVAAVAGIFFSGLKAALDLRSLVSSIRVIRALKEAKRTAEATGASKGVVAAVDYAIRQKYEKVVKRALGAATALASLGVGLAILIANPVGASLAAVILGGIGVGVFLYKIGRWAWKKWKTKSLGEKRKQMAQRLYNQIRTGDVGARAAVRALHLDPIEVGSDPGGVALIERKLKSA